MTDRASTGRHGWLVLLVIVLIGDGFARSGLPAVFHAASLHLDHPRREFDLERRLQSVGPMPVSSLLGVALGSRRRVRHS